KFFEVLADCGALAKLFPAHTMEGEGMRALKEAARLTNDPVVRFATFMIPLSDKDKHLHYINEICHRYRIPNAYKELAKLTARYYDTALRAHTLSADELLSLFSGLDIFRREERFKQFLQACLAIARAKARKFDPDWLPARAKA